MLNDLPYLSAGEGPPLVVLLHSNWPGRRWVEGIPDAQLVVYPGRSHSGTFTDKRFAPDALAFLTDS